ncbi:MAG: sulfatase-like hydrolase/transferase [Myxococcota bacterium]
MLLLLACAAPERPAVADEGSPGTPKNLLTIGLDTLRRDALSRYGGAGDAPFLDGLLDESFALDAQRSCSNWTFPAMLCVWREVSGLDAGYVPDIRDPDAVSAPDGDTLPQKLREAGFTTINVTANAWLTDERNGAIGFDVVHRPDVRDAGSLLALARAEVEALDEGTRWYAHAHVIEPHHPFSPPEEYLGALEGLDPIAWDLDDKEQYDDVAAAWPRLTEEERALVQAHLYARYAGEVAWLDDALAASFAEWDDAGLLDDTLVVFFSDHGEQLFEHGDLTHAYGFHAEENDAVTFFWQKGVAAGSWTEPTTLTDLPPTLLDRLGLPVDADASGHVVGTAPSDRALLFSEVGLEGPRQAVVADGWKLTYDWYTGAKTLHDLDADPAEAVDLYDPEHARAVALWEILMPEVDRFGALLPGDTPVDAGP